MRAHLGWGLGGEQETGCRLSGGIFEGNTEPGSKDKHAHVSMKERKNVYVGVRLCGNAFG